MHQDTRRLGRSSGRHETLTIWANPPAPRKSDDQHSFAVEQGTQDVVLILPAAVLIPLLGGRQVVGSTRSGEMRVLTAHSTTVNETVVDLTEAGLQSARDALMELAQEVMGGEDSRAETRPTPALARAAMEIADRRISDADLSPSVLARELNVSRRTLYRAIAATEESVGAYIRRRRLERAWLDLATQSARLSVSEVAARWHFADSSHFSRAFKEQYKETPSQFTRSRAAINDSDS